LLHHSDRGCQYASKDYRKLLEQHQMKCLRCAENFAAGGFAGGDGEVAFGDF
jgi:hypothetical protein